MGRLPHQRAGDVATAARLYVAAASQAQTLAERNHAPSGYHTAAASRRRWLSAPVAGRKASRPGLPATTPNPQSLPPRGGILEPALTPERNVTIVL
jgi:hypothetical protein